MIFAIKFYVNSRRRKSSNYTENTMNDDDDECGNAYRRKEGRFHHYQATHKFHKYDSIKSVYTFSTGCFLSFFHELLFDTRFSIQITFHLIKGIESESTENLLSNIIAFVPFVFNELLLFNQLKYFTLIFYPPHFVNAIFRSNY